VGEEKGVGGRHLELLLPLDAVAREAKLLLVAPHDARPSLDAGLGQHVVQSHDLVAPLVACKGA
jgi:hypothetical protein